MKEADENLNQCKRMALNFFKDKDSTNCLDIIIDLYDEVRYSIASEAESKQKLLRVLFNLSKSDSLGSLLDKSNKETLTLLIDEFLDIRFDGNKYYIRNENFAKLSSNECYNILICIKYSKTRKNMKPKQLSI